MPRACDLVQQAVRRTLNVKKLAAEKAGVAVTTRGFINIDVQMRTNVPPIFAIGDIVAHTSWRARWCTECMWQQKSLPGDCKATENWRGAVQSRAICGGRL